MSMSGGTKLSKIVHTVFDSRGIDFIKKGVDLIGTNS